MSELKDAESQASGDEISNSRSSETKTDGSILDHRTTIGNEGSCATQLEMCEEQANNSEPTTEERKSISDELGIMELSKSDEISINIVLATDNQNPTQLTSPEHSDFLFIEGEFSNQRPPSPRSPIKRRHPSSKEDLESGTEFKKTTIDGGPSILDKNPILLSQLAKDSGEESTYSFLEALEREEINSKNASSEAGSVSSNATDDSLLFEVREVPRSRRELKLISAIYDKFMKEERSEKANEIFGGILNKCYEINRSAIDSATASVPDLDPDNKSISENALVCKNSDASTEIDIGETSSCTAQSDSSNASKIAQKKEIEERRKLLRNIKSSLSKFRSCMESLSFDGPDEEKHLRDLLKRHTVQLNIFEASMEKLVDELQGMMSLPLNASLLILKVNEVFQAALNVEQVWMRFNDLLLNNRDSVTVKIMYTHYAYCSRCFQYFTEKIYQYLRSFPEDYPN